MGSEDIDNTDTGKVASKGILLTLKTVWISCRSIVAIVMIVTLYLLPTGIAMIRGRRNTVAIFALNFFLGFILVG